MRFGKSVTFIATGVILAGMLAGKGRINTEAAESTTPEYALSIALKDAGLTEDDVTIDEIEKGTERGASVYEIEFQSDSKDYEYNIAIADGEIVIVSWDLTDPALEGKQINQTQAKKIALKDSGVNENNASFKKSRNGTENGVPVFEFEFEDTVAEYKYDIAKQGGEILSYTKTIKIPACAKAATDASAK